MSAYLSRLVLDLRSDAVRRDLSDVHQLHRTIMSQFPPDGGNRASQQVLFRLEFPRFSHPVVLIQSATRPTWSLADAYLSEPPETKDISGVLGSITSGQPLRFRLRANPARRPASPDRPNAPRIPITAHDALIDWLARKLADIGARLISSDAARKPHDTGRAGEHRITIWPVLFEGTLVVEDPDLFRRGIVAGIGPARAYGNGLLSVAPVKRPSN